jgi:hypothetical protein
MPKHLRVALFTDSYPETNGVGTFSREFARFARENARPFLAVYGGTRTGLRRDGSLTEIELCRGPATFPLDRDIVLSAVKDFQPHLVQFTGPSDISIMGLWVSNEELRTFIADRIVSAEASTEIPLPDAFPHHLLTDRASTRQPLDRTALRFAYSSAAARSPLSVIP